jgi:pyrimidine-nucleoside phosphorylase
VDLSLYKNYEFPKSRIDLLLRSIHSILDKQRPHGIVFDLRVDGWPETQSLRKARDLSQSLQNICDNLKINSSVFLTNGHQPLGNAFGTKYELTEAGNVLKGTGPLDLKKYTMEIGSDLLLLTEKFQQKIEAKKFIKDEIIEGRAAYKPMAIKESSPSTLSSKKIGISSHRKGYIHCLPMEAIFETMSKTSPSCHEYGMHLLKKVGDRTEKGDILVEIFSPQNKEMHRIQKDIQKAYIISAKPPDFQPLILERPGIRMTA